MSEKEYTVIVNNREDLADIEAELTASSGSGPIPDRTVDVANPRPGSKIQTHFMLTDEEAADLRTDPRIRAVEIPPDQRDDIQIGLWLTQTGNFTRSNSLNQNDINWGLRRCMETTNTYANNTTVAGGFLSALGGKGVDIVIQDSGIDAEHPEFEIAGAIDPEYNNGAIINVTGDGSDFFKREVTVNGVRIMGAGTVGGQTAVPDAWLEKVARMFELFTDPNGAGINEEYQRNLIKTLSGDTGTYHAGLPTIQRVARGAGADYTPNFLTDQGVIDWNLTNLFDTTVQNDMVWYLNSTGDGYGDGDTDAQEVIEHVFHTLHMHGLPADDIKLYQFLAADWQTGDLYAAMEEAYDAGKWDPSGYQTPADAWKTDADAFEVAAKEYLFLLNFSMFEYTELWDGGSLAPEWTDDMRTQAGIQANNPLGYAFHNTYIAPVISKPSLATIRSIFQDGNTPAQDDPSLAGASGYVVDTAGTSRVQQIDWYTASGVSGTQDTGFYTDYDGHGTHCAGIAAGKTYGWAKSAHIYAQKLAGLEGTLDPNNGISITDAFDTIRLWHNAKTNGRPTVVNMSWGYQTQQTGDPTSGNYRGSAWVWNPPDFVEGYDSRSGLWSGTGVVDQVFSSGGTPYSIHPVQVAAVDAEIDDMIADGVHVVIAAGNDLHKTDVPGGDDYDNTVVFNGVTYNYHRPSSPHSAGAFNVGNIDYHTAELIGPTGTDIVSDSSTRGPAIDIWAPGTNIMSTSSRNYDTGKFSVLDYPANTNYKIMEISGTSMAAPQVAGLLALHLESLPKLSPADAKSRVVNDARTDVIYETGNNDTDYTQYQDSIMGAPNKFLYSRYAVAQPFSIGGFSQTSGIVGATYALSASSTSINEGDTVTVTLTTTSIPDDFEVAYAVSGIQAGDLSSGNLSGNFTISSNTATISFTLAEDVTTEGVETMTVSLNNGQSSVAIAIADTSASNYALSSSAASVNEGGSFTITLTTTGVPDGTTQAYTVTGVSASDISESLTGTFTINSNTASATFNVTNDFSTEGSETFTLSLDGRGESVDVLIIDTSGTPVYNNLINDTGGLDDVNEGETLTFTLTGTNIPNGTTIGYTVSGTNISSGDISGAPLTGIITMTDGSGSVTFTISEDATSEGSEQLVFTLDATDSNGANTGGLSQTITINDTSESPAADYTINIVGVSGNPRYLQISGEDRVRTYSNSTGLDLTFYPDDTVNLVNNSGRTLYVTDTVDDLSPGILDGNTYNLTVGSAGAYAIRADGNPSVNDTGLNSRLQAGITLSSNTNIYDLNTTALSTNGYTYVAGYTDITLTINSSIWLYSGSTTTPALQVRAFDTGDNVSIVNNGYIVGKGGDGVLGDQGTDGGNAIDINRAVSITNNSYIAGGGGGGGGSGGYGGYGVTSGGGGAGGGNVTGGFGGSPGGLGQSGSNGTSEWSGNGNATAGGGGGGYVLPGTGGAGGGALNTSYAGRGGGAGGSGGSVSGAFGTACVSGNGGSAGNAGQNGTLGNVGGAAGGGGGWGAAGGNAAGNSAYQPYNGGAGGKCVNLNGNSVTWAVTGTRYGSIS